MCIAAAVFQIPYSRNSRTLRDGTLRLHVIANSDSDADQTVKLAVRDALLNHSELLFSQSDDVQAAQTLVSVNLAALEQTANAVLRENGLPYTAHAEVVSMFFERRDYGGVTLPAGFYTALRVELGAADGKNWWCVLYPKLCLPAATDADVEAALAQYTDAERAILQHGDRYVVRFQIEEWIQEWKNKK